MDTKQLQFRKRRRGILGSAVCLCAMASTAVSGFVTPRSLVPTLAVIKETPTSPIAQQAWDTCYDAALRTCSTGRITNGVSLSLSSTNVNNNPQHEFELNVGRAMDVLRKDYPKILTRSPDFSIYDQDVECIDPSGVKLHGLRNYKQSFKLVHAIVNIFYCPDRSSISFRMCFDKARQNIRIHWNAKVVPRTIFGGEKTTLHVDGISVYEVGRVTGNITQHRVERLIVNDAMVMPEQGVVWALRRYAVKENLETIPPIFNSEENTAFMGPSSAANDFSFDDTSTVSEGSSPDSRLSAMSSTGGDMPSSAEGGTNNNVNIDWEAFERRNASRKKFGLSPLTPEEFAELQEKVAELDSQQQQKRASAAAEMSRKKEEVKGGFFSNLLGKVLEDTCESNFDCERPELCCDFGFKKICCNAGTLVGKDPRDLRGRLAEVPVPIQPGGRYPPNQPRYPPY